MNPPLRLACLISGGGRTLLNIADHIDQGRLNARVDLVIASRPDIAGVELAKQRGFDVRIACRRDFSSLNRLDDAVSDWITEKKIGLVCLCGYLCKIRVDPSLQGKIMNIHPALLPDFGGVGMHGEHVHRAVLQTGRMVSGCTVHFVDEHYDHGPIILQRTCPVLADDTPQTLAARVFEQECMAYPQAIGLYEAGRLRIEGGRVTIQSPGLPPHQNSVPNPAKSGRDSG